MRQPDLSSTRGGGAHSNCRPKPRARSRGPVAASFSSLSRFAAREIMSLAMRCRRRDMKFARNDAGAIRAEVVCSSNLAFPLVLLTRLAAPTTTTGSATRGSQPTEMVGTCTKSKPARRRFGRKARMLSGADQSVEKTGNSGWIGYVSNTKILGRCDSKTDSQIESRQPTGVRHHDEGRAGFAALAHAPSAGGTTSSVGRT
jgi:hypothetical protein